MKVSSINNKLIYTLMILLILLLSACGSTQKAESMDPNMKMPSYEENYAASDEYIESGEENHSSAANSEALTEITDENTTTKNSRKLIKTGNVDIRTDDVEHSYQEIIGLVKQYNGFEINLERNESDSYLSVYGTYDIPADRFDDFLDELQSKQDVKNIDISAEDITASYFDTTIRLESQERSLNQYYDLLDKAESMEDIILLQDEINQITEEIEQLKGQLRYWDSQVNYSKISISILEYADKLHTNREVKFSALSWDDFSYFISTGWTKVLNIIVAILQWGAIALLVILPIAIPIGLIVFLIIHFSKKKKAKQKQMMQVTNEDTKKE